VKYEYGLFKRQRKKGYVWYFWYWKDGVRKYQSTGKTNKKEAGLYAEIFLNAKAPKQIPTLARYTRDFYIWDHCPWIKRQHAKGRSFSRTMAQMRRAHLKTYILPAFGRKELSSLNAVEVENWLISLPLANQTKNHILRTLNIVMREAAREHLVQHNPIADIESLSVMPKRRDTLSGSELNVLFPYNRKEFENIWPILWHGFLYALAVSSGMRSGELRALQWGAVIWNPGGVLVLQAITRDNVIGEPKGKGRRSILLPDRTIALLEWWKTLTRYSDPGDFVFAGRNGHWLSARSITINLRPGLVRADISTEGRNIVAHSLRHTYNTKMRELLTGDVLRYFTGHKSLKMTDHYDRPFLEDRLLSFDKLRPQVEEFWK